MGNVSRTSKISLKGERRLSLDRFRQLAQEHLANIAQTEQSLQEACIPFMGRGDIQPDHCRFALDSLDEMNGHIAELEELLYQTSWLPSIVIALRYQLLFILHRFEKQASQLEEILSDYLMICFTSSQSAQRLRKEINSQCEKLLQYSRDIAEQTKLLNDEARFQEQEMLSLFQKE